MSARLAGYKARRACPDRGWVTTESIGRRLSRWGVALVALGLVLSLVGIAIGGSLMLAVAP